jgi:cell division septum initiation protein DivIVA
MTEKELRRLHRQDLLQLLLLQGKEYTQLREENQELTERIRALEEDRSRMAGWLDEKDETIRSLKSRLEKDHTVLLTGDPEQLPIETSVNELLETIKKSLEARLPENAQNNDKSRK